MSKHYDLNSFPIKLNGEKTGYLHSVAALSIVFALAIIFAIPIGILLVVRKETAKWTLKNLRQFSKDVAAMPLWICGISIFAIFLVVGLIW